MDEEQELLRRISMLVHEEQELLQKKPQPGEPEGDWHARIQAIEAELKRAWEMIRRSRMQRAAVREQETGTGSWTVKLSARELLDHYRQRKRRR